MNEKIQDSITLHITYQLYVQNKVTYNKSVVAKVFRLQNILKYKIIIFQDFLSLCFLWFPSLFPNC